MLRPAFAPRLPGFPEGALIAGVRRALAPACLAVLAGLHGACDGSSPSEVDPGEEDPPPTFDETGTWEARAPLPTAVRRAAAAEFRGSLFVVGGYAGEEPTVAAQRYDPDADAWFPVADLPEPLGDATLVAFRDTLILVGGNAGLEQSIVPRSAVLRYDPDADRWREHSVLPERRFEHGALAADGMIVVVGGGGFEAPPGDSTALYTAADGWRHGPPPPGRHGRPLSVFGVAVNEVLAFRGGSGSSLHRFDPAAGEWTVQSSVHPVSEITVQGTGWNDRLHVLSIAGSDTFHRAYDASAGRWLALPPMPEPVRDATVAGLGQRLFVAGGELRSGESSRGVWSFRQP